MMTKNRYSLLANAFIYEVSVRNYSEEGTLSCVTKDLSRIKALGVDIIYLMPIHPISKINRKGKDGSLYAIANYREINPDLGDENDLRQLIDNAHELGLKIIMDVVFNHTGRDSLLLQKHPEWFLQDEKGNPSLKFEDWWDIYDLDFSKHELWDYLIDCLQIWVNLDVDGFRCDVAPMIPMEFWSTARQHLDQTKEIIWIAESVPPSFLNLLRNCGFNAQSGVELHQVFDITYDYDSRECLEQYWRGQGEIKDFLQLLFLQQNLYPKQANIMRFLENHDLPRIAEVITNPVILRNWTVFNLLLPGATMISAGQENMVVKQASLFEKEWIPWNTGDSDFTRFFTKALALAKKIKQNSTQFKIEEYSKGVIHIQWSTEKGIYIAILNLEDRYGELAIPDSIIGQDLLGDTPVKIDNKYKIQKEPLIIFSNR